MPVLGRASKRRLNTCHPLLVALVEAAIKDSPVDFSVIWGHRNEKQQNRAYRLGNSTKRWPDSRHNKQPSLAVDLAPYYREKPHWRWEEMEPFYFLGGWVLAIAQQIGIRITWGGMWAMKDLGHFQLDL